MTEKHAGLGALALIAITAVGGASYVFSGAAAPTPAGQVFILVGSVVTILVTVIAAAALFSGLGLADKSQALGLPDGSVRAVVALVLLTVFIGVPLFLYNSLDTATQTIQGLTEQQKTDLQLKLGKDFLVAVQSTEKPDSPFTIYYRVTQPEKVAFANQLLTAIITLVASVSSFFFGAGVVKSAQNRLDPPTGDATGKVNPLDDQPRVDPPTGAVGQSVTLKINKLKMANVQAIKLTAPGFNDVAATDFAPFEGGVQCVVSLLGVVPGRRDVQITSRDGSQETLKNAFTVIAK